MAIEWTEGQLGGNPFYTGTIATRPGYPGGGGRVRAFSIKAAANGMFELRVA